MYCATLLRHPTAPPGPRRCQGEHGQGLCPTEHARVAEVVLAGLLHMPLKAGGEDAALLRSVQRPAAVKFGPLSHDQPPSSPAMSRGTTVRRCVMKSCRQACGASLRRQVASKPMVTG